MLSLEHHLCSNQIKDPSTATVTMFLKKYGLKDISNMYIQTDQSGELARSEVRKMAQQFGYSIETAGANNSSQNGRRERPHRTYGNMVRCLVYSSSLSAEFGSDTLMHSCYIFHRTYHTAIKQTPYEAWGGHKPNLKHMRSFGIPVTVKKLDHHPSKGHPHVHHGIFLRFTGTAKNIV